MSWYFLTVLDVINNNTKIDKEKISRGIQNYFGLENK